VHVHLVALPSGTPALEPWDLILIRVLPGGLFPLDRTCDLGNDVPLETVANRSVPVACGPNVDQARPARGGSGAPHRGPWLARRPPPAAPDKRARPAIALLGGALAGSGPGTSPYVGAIPGQRHGYPSVLPVQTMRTMVGFLDDMAPAGPITPGCSEAGARRLGEVRFEPGPMLLRRPRLWRWMRCDLRFQLAGCDRWCPPRTRHSRCRTDPARTRIPSLEGASDEDGPGSGVATTAEG
jgi:hypothetical protein